MAEFRPAFDVTMGHEGRAEWSDDHDDPGGETVGGISRVAHPTLALWEIVDRAKPRANFPESLKSNGELKRLIRDFYKQAFWDKIRGDKIPSQAVANEVFDTGINLEMWDAVVFLQVALNALNRKGRLFPDLKEDGDLGGRTLGALSAYLRKDKVGPLLTLLNCFQGVDYVVDGDFARLLIKLKRGEWREKYMRGWIKRVSLVKTG